MVSLLRCPYCVLLTHFMPMDPTGDGRWVCSKCQHTVVPNNQAFECLCTHCARMRAFETFKPFYSWPQPLK